MKPSDWYRKRWEAASSTELASAATWMAVEMLATWWVRKVFGEVRPSP